MTLEEIKQLLQAVVETGVAEIEVQRGDSRVRIRRTMKGVEVYPQQPTFTFQAAAAQPSYEAPQPARPPSPSAPPEPAAPPAADPSLVLVKSPIVGTFYESPSPGSPPFVRSGDVVSPGQVLCIIESMKLMNEIEAEIAGEVVARLVENGRPVEYGEALFSIRPR